jgi:hypothetical protein
MDATPISFDTATPLDGPPLGAFARAQERTAEKWITLHDAAFVVATLAGVSPSPLAPELQVFSATVRDAPRWLREIAEQGVDDLAAIMEPGLAALIAVHGSGADVRAPAQALWQEFVASRDALLRLMRPLG